jgi:preprotein translocase subunit SecG
MMIAVILLQKSEGSGMSGSSAANMFAGVLTGASAGNFLTKLTAILATLFFVLCAALALVVSNSGNTRPVSEIRQELNAAASQAEVMPESAPETAAAPDFVDEIQIPTDTSAIPED